MQSKSSKINWIILVLIGVLLFIVLASCQGRKIGEEISKDKHFRFETALTNEAAGGDRAKVYVSDMGVAETAKYIIKRYPPREHSDVGNKEQVSILYEDEYVFVYAGKGDKTYVQVSSRRYAYTGGMGLYSPRSYGAWDFFRDYYVMKALTSDFGRYRDWHTPYKNYKPKTTTIPVDPVKPKTTKIQRSDDFKIRRSSSGVRTPMGGGTSFGK